MATAKLWWNGSAWGTTDTTAASKSSYSSGNPGIKATIKLVAFDDATIKLYATLSPDGQSGESNVLSGTFSVSYGGVSVAVSDGTGRSGDLRQAWSSATSTATGTISWSTGTYDITGTYYRGGAKYYNRLQWTSSQSVGTSPFCTVSFNANGGSDAPASQTVCKGASATLTESVPTRANHTFLGWATSSSAHTADYSAGGSITVSSDTTLYAVWGPAVFISADDGATITFNGTDYTNTTATIQNLVYGNSYSVAITANTGFIIKTRSPASDGSVTLVDEQTFSATSQRVGCHIDDGDDFVQAVMYVDNGVSYDMVQAYVDNGVSWELVY